MNPSTAEAATVILVGKKYGDVVGTALGLFFGVLLVILTAAVYIRVKGTDVFVSKRRDRLPLLTVGAIYHAIGALVMCKVGVTRPMVCLMLTYAIAAMAVAGVTRFWKISIHAASMGTVMGAIAWLGEWWAGIPWSIVTAVVCWARLKLNAHTGYQVAVGVAGGTLLTYVLMITLIPR
ncbi:hypothetical protein [Methanopyrus kandleri]|uniref:Membrane-associated phospholipid phosphatase n=1 Tax=Methanopyrus kandleri TaxID=2320 RepID=A0A832STM1_9EURY|nr:hypothetical protein [Methanopyrus kandleri]HII70107.1 hypothetical protein [Methanopyrus kandleri]